ncbi:MAG TPA: hypothetical protein VFN21_03305 [Acidimicrobiales bacterium]|nr:hypothetical protein [Acidimicrobiales bacterium]
MSAHDEPTPDPAVPDPAVRGEESLDDLLTPVEVPADANADPAPDTGIDVDAGAEPGADDDALAIAEAKLLRAAESWDDLVTPIPTPRPERADLPPLEPGWPATRDRLVAWVFRVLRQPLSSWVTLAVVVAASGYVLWNLHPGLLVRNTTPTGGDMGAHVWGPMYLMRHVLPEFRFTGWTPDWYAGFPAFGYYMVVPAYAIVAITKGVPGFGAVPAVLVSAAIAVSGFVSRRLFAARKVLLVVGLILVVVSIPVPYNIAFKWVTVIGLVTMPISAWAFAKLADLRFPAPPIFAVAALVFVYNREPLVRYPSSGELIGTGNIIGGNMLSTMAGEYSFSIALSLSLVYFGVLARSMRTGRHRALAAGLLALVGLCHLLPFFFALLLTVVLFLLRPSFGRFKMLAVIGVVAGALAAFWMLPFVWYRKFTIDMGFEQLPPEGLGYTDYLFPSRMTWIFLLAAVGIVVALVFRNRIGQLLLGCAVATALAFRFMPQIQLWNARILPFYYLSLIFLAAFGVFGVIFALSTLVTRAPGRPNAYVTTGFAVLAALAVFVFVGLPLHKLPGGSMKDGKYHFLFFQTADQNPGPGWAEWNYSGYEGRTAATATSANPYAEYRDLIQTMDRLGNDPAHGCGRAMWEADNEREGSYGTPMALMLLPYWTDSCIGSMEGLYFESSATTPFHFINASELSAKPSNPMRGLPYPGLNVASGIEHLQLLGVKYYLADTAETIAAADDVPELTKVATSGPWHVYQIADAKLVTPLTHEPAVWDVHDQAVSSVQPSVAWYLDPTRWDVPFAFTGPSDWKRVKVDTSYWDHEWSTLTDIVTQTSGKSAEVPLPRVTTPALPEVKVSNIDAGTDTISFDVDKVGVPVRVKASYFPNWKVDGAEGPYRITPNQMVVIPTSKHVTLHYGRTPVDWIGIILLFAGFAALAYLGRRPAVAVASPMYERLREKFAARWRERFAAQWAAAKNVGSEPAGGDPPGGSDAGFSSDHPPVHGPPGPASGEAPLGDETVQSSADPATTPPASPAASEPQAPLDPVGNRPEPDDPHAAD